ncbi:hypothetical protein B0H13DRAFT_2288141 [Mycena leptocephala]|nr:hypothetical protein B0H13DRAFT_2288141 [Mycena leptocephala]
MERAVFGDQGGDALYERHPLDGAPAARHQLMYIAPRSIRSNISNNQAAWLSLPDTSRYTAFLPNIIHRMNASGCSHASTRVMSTWHFHDTSEDTESSLHQATYCVQFDEGHTTTPGVLCLSRFKFAKQVYVGKIGNYERCQFHPTAAANPTVGHPGELEYVDEDRVEVLVLDRMREVVQALKAVHPYEEVAYDVYKLEDY